MLLVSTRRSRPFLKLCALLTLLIAAAMAIPASRQAIFVGLGQMLVVAQNTDRADAIVISQDADGAGVLAAADLVARGVAQRVAVFSDPPDSVDSEFLRRGLTYYNTAAISELQLRTLGVTRVEQIPRTVLGTEDAAAKLVEWCVTQGLSKVVFVVYSDHSRRARRLLDRALAGTSVTIFVHPSPYSPFDPANWWHDRGSVRIQVIETQKLLWDVLRHPFS
jgi:hypothetical protein